MIERLGPPVLATSSTGLAAVCAWRSSLDCGCHVDLGRRTDNQEAATLAKACAPKHDALIARFQETFTASLESPEDRPAIEVIDEHLRRAAA